MDTLLEATPAAAATTRRSVQRVIPAVHAIEGEGMRVRRALPAAALEAVGPFIFLDHFGPVDFGPGEARGAPNHPHRGFETLTYLLEGEAEHRDSLGNRSTVGGGEAQWMRAGSGILHDEGASEAIRRHGGRVHGLQFWINLPKGKKMSPPAYRHLARGSIPEFMLGDARLRLIAGRHGGHEGPVQTFAQPWLAHVRLPAGGRVVLSPEAAEIGVYVASGTLLAGARTQPLTAGDLALAGRGDALELVAGASPVDAFVLGGEPLDAPIRRHGPFVMNTDAELWEAVRDFQAGAFGAIADA